MKQSDYLEKQVVLTQKKKDYLMPTFREVDVFQKVGKVALAYPKLPSFSESVPCVNNERIGIHSPFFQFLTPPFDKYNLFSWVYVFQRKCGRLANEQKA